MTDDEVLELRNSITGLNNQPGDPRQAWLTDQQIERLYRKVPTQDKPVGPTQDNPPQSDPGKTTRKPRRKS